MSIESHVVSLEMAGKLDEAGWIKDTEFVWTFYEPTKNYPQLSSWHVGYSRTKLGWGKGETIKDEIFAPLATEILDELPISLKGEFIQDLTIRKDDEGYFNINYGCRILVSGIGLPDTFAKMWIWMRKEKLL
jgi:hypothetical protein